MPKHKIKKSIAVLLTATLTGTMLPCGATNLVPFNPVKPVVPQSVPVTKPLTESKPSSDGFSVQSVKSKINDIVNPQNAKPKLKATSGSFDGVTWTLDDNDVLTISGSGEIPESAFDAGEEGEANAIAGSITSVIINDGVTSIGDYAFLYCSNLKSVTIPNSVTSIGEGAFAECGDLTSINVDSNNENYKSIDGVLFNNAGTSLIQYPIGNSRTYYEIPDSVTSIGYAAFYGCSALTSVTIPDSVTSIEEETFYGCSALTSVTIPDSVTSIEDMTFCRCTGLTSVTIPDSVTSIGYAAFGGCRSLSSINFLGTTAPSSDNDAFYGAGEGLKVYVPTIYQGSKFGGKTVTKSIPSGYCGKADVNEGKDVTWVRDGEDKLIISGTDEMTNDFQAVDSTLIKSIMLRNGVTIGDTSFDGFSSLEEIKVDSNNRNYQSVDGVLFDKEGTSLIKWPDAKTSFKLDNDAEVSIMSVLRGAESSPISQIQEVTIGKDVTSIEAGAFEGCSALTAINVDDGNANFKSMDGMLLNKAGTTLIKWPDAKTSFELNNNAEVSIIIPLLTAGSLPISKIQKIIIGKDFTYDIGSLTFNGFSSLEEIEVDSNNTNYQSVDGVLLNKDGTTLIKCPAGNTRASYEIPNTVQTIGAGAFGGCSKLTSITIPSTVTSIEAGAFNGCSTLTSVRFNGTQDLNLDIFTGCTSLEKINVPGEYQSDKFCGKDVIKDYYKITYDVNGGTLADGSPDKYYVTTGTTLVAPSRTGYDFAGWKVTGTTETVTGIPENSTGDKFFTANWTAKNYDITYNLNGGALAEGDTNPAKYTIESDAITLKNPTREGYIFTGWTGSNGQNPQTEVTIPKGSTENKNYVANWEKEEDQIVNTPTPENSKLSGGAIAGIVIGSVAAVAAATVGTILCLKNRQSDITPEASDQAVPEDSAVAV